MSDWKIDVVAPNGLTGQLVVDESADPVKEFAAFVDHCREHDLAPDGPEIAGPAATQPRKEPRG